MVSSYIGSEFEVFIIFCDIVISKSINVSHSILTYPNVKEMNAIQVGGSKYES